MNAIKFALAATVMAFSVTATAQIVYIPEFPATKSQTVQAPAVDTASTETVEAEAKKAA
ncbi:hypothetical protein [Acinetobacter wanghuae]|uniref:hypothetical protein n=1 Tax=Acinetobacter wanghuae TaxID=2662362 RepID=UPI00148F105B|nr:hypothetical protein [Acinetobacter wanghuae]